jgi:tetratricopeptide (TPR) repeat protein
MIKFRLVCIFVLGILGNEFAGAATIDTDSLTSILKNKDVAVKKRELILYLRYSFGDMPQKDLSHAREETVRILKSAKEQDSEGLILFIDGICRYREQNYNLAQNTFLKAIEKANQNDDHYVLYGCFTHMAFIQNERGNEIEAISDFRAAKKEATIVNDAYLQIVIDINLSDIYYRNRMFNHALVYLNEAQSLINSNRVKIQRMKTSVNYNKAEVYYRSKKIDSLKKYNRILHESRGGTDALYTFQKRTDYYLDLLQKKYEPAIMTITGLRRDSSYHFEASDYNSLADAYFESGHLDSAKSIVQKLIDNGREHNHTELNLFLYKLLGDIEDRNNNQKEAAVAYKQALSQSLEQLKRLINVGSVSSQISIDEIQNSYALRTETYKRERLWLIFIISVAVLLILFGSLLYYNVHRKKYYEKLLFESKRNEIAFINSHEVRRHSSNIMGIMQMINQGEDKYENFIEAEQYLMTELTNLDNAIKNISNKLNS